MDLSKKLNLTQVQVEGSGFCVPGHETLGAPTKGKRVFCRVDYNVPLDDECKVTDPRRIESTVDTIKTLLALKPQRLVLCSHLGRPKGNVKAKLSLRPVLPILQELIGQKVEFVEDWFKPDLEARLAAFPEGSVILLENVRFYVEEEGKGVDAAGEKVKADAAKQAEFRALLTSLADLYVNDAFGCAHRAHSSVVGVEVPLRAAGLLVKKELEYFDKALSTPQRPYLGILGGAKVSDKIPVIKSLLDRVDELVIAGGMCYTFRKVADNMEIGKSLFDDEGAKTVEELLAKAKEKGVKIVLPTDFLCAPEFKADAPTQVVTMEQGIAAELMGLDIGPASQAEVAAAIARAKTVVWNGPPGVFEFDSCKGGTMAVLEAIAKATEAGAATIVGGGDSAAAAKKFGFDDKVSHVSTGGGASLELLEGKVLPGVAHLSDL